MHLDTPAKRWLDGRVHPVVQAVVRQPEWEELGTKLHTSGGASAITAALLEKQEEGGSAAADDELMADADQFAAAVIAVGESTGHAVTLEERATLVKLVTAAMSSSAVQAEVADNLATHKQLEAAQVLLPLPADLAPTQAACVFLRFLDSLIVRLDRVTPDDQAPFLQAPHVVEPAALGLLAQLLEKQLVAQAACGSADADQQMICLVLLRLARVNMSWAVKEGGVVVQGSLVSDCKRLAGVLNAFMAGADAQQQHVAVDVAEIRDEAAAAYGAGISVFLEDASTRCECACQLLRQPETCRSNRLVSLVLASLAVPEVLLQLLANVGDTVSSSSSVLDLTDAALSYCQSEWGRWTTEALPAERRVSAHSEIEIVADSWGWGGPKDGDISISNGGKRVSKKQSSGCNDYSIALGDTEFAHGTHEWALTISGDVDGVTIGVCSSDI
eukprot:COSAG01_NODE_11163_length_1992_cov_1.524036_2_plen_443_part_01